MKTGILDRLCRSGVVGIALVIGLIVHRLSFADPIELATSPLVNSTTTSVRPNLMFILDNSGSMNWDYMPDLVVDGSYCKGSAATGTNYRCCRNASGDNLSSSSRTSTCLPTSNNYRGMPPFYAAEFNKIYYDPEVTYAPPVTHAGVERTSYTGTSAVPLDGYGVQTSNTLDLLASYPDVEWCTNTNYTDCLRNDNYLLPGTVNGKSYTTMRVTTASGTKSFAIGSVDSPATESRAAGPFYYVMVPGEYCTDSSLSDCVTASGPSESHPVAATLRWCRNADRTDCKAVQSSTYNYPRYPTIVTSGASAGTGSTASITVSNVSRSDRTGTGSDCNRASNVVTVSSIRANGVEMLSAEFRYCNGNSNQNTRNRELASEIESRIGNGFSASRSQAVITVTAPDASYNGVSLIYGISGASLGSASFSGGAFPTSMTFVPGAFRRIDIVSGPTYGNIVVDGTTILDRSKRTDCAAAPNCTYEEELKNFANWFAWYRTRMQAMKTSVSRAFVTIDSSYRVGFFALNNQDNNYLKIDNFALGTGNQKDNWYQKLADADPDGGTPLRSTLAQIGRIYAGQLRDDPVQYSCQQNFSLLTSDGYWNTDRNTDRVTDVKNLSGTPVGNQDGGATERPMYEGPTASSDSLADVAKYYYETDLRTSDLRNCTGALGSSEDVCKNNVFVSQSDNNSKQHMTTFTLGLGVNGELAYTSDYKTAASGDFYDIRRGVKNWPVPAADSPRAVDDMWHAAVNGRGTYFSADNPHELAKGLKEALAEMQVTIGAGAAAATSTLAPVEGDNFAYVASYTTVRWTGNLEAREIDVNTGAVSQNALMCVENVTEPVACTGTMASKVGASSDSRSIWTKGASGLVSFEYDNLSTAQKAYFGADYLASRLSQWASLTADERSLAAGENLVNFLRGQYGYEDRTANENKLYRKREAVLGDLIESTPNFMAKPKFRYTDPGYSAFVEAHADREATIYVGANDGMLHAFNATNMTERWAYIPSMVMPELWRLADKNYASGHRYYVNGAPVVSDICSANCGDAITAVWKTILVSGLNGGGKGYFALDVTDPDAPALLWEFTQVDDSDLGYSYGNPVVTKLDDGTWAVLLTSGYNNIDGSSPGKGFLYVVNAVTGDVIRKIGTGEGDADTPSGLAKISTWVDDLIWDNTAGYTYGGDVLGNVWRFDVNAAAADGVNPLKFATLFADDAGTEPQPVTTRPELGKVYGKRMIFVGTGKYLELGDLTDSQRQTIYAIRDDDATTTLVNPRILLVEQTLTETEDATRTGSSNTVSVSAHGWFVDLPDDGERQNVDSKLVRGVLVVPTTVPETSACEPGGYSWLNHFDYKTGAPVNLGTMLMSTRFSAPIVGVNITFVNGDPVELVVTSNNPTPGLADGPGFPAGGGDFQKKRAIWREVLQ